MMLKESVLFLCKAYVTGQTKYMTPFFKKYLNVHLSYSATEEMQFVLISLSCVMYIVMVLDLIVNNITVYTHKQYKLFCLSLLLSWK